MGDDTLRPPVTVSLQNGVIYANLCKFMQMSCDVIGHVTALDESEPSTRLTRSAPGDSITAKQCLKGDNRG